MTDRRNNEIRDTDSPEAHERIDTHVRNDAKRWWYLAWAIIVAFVLIAVVSTAFLILLGQVRTNTEDANNAARQANIAAAKANATAIKVNSVAASAHEAAEHATAALCFEVVYLDNVIKQTKNLIRLDSDPARRETRLQQLQLTNDLLDQLKSAVGNDCPKAPGSSKKP